MIDVQNRFAYVFHIAYTYVKKRGTKKMARVVIMSLAPTKFKTTTVELCQKPYNLHVVCLKVTYVTELVFKMTYMTCELLLRLMFIEFFAVVSGS